MNKVKPIVAHNSTELAKILHLSPFDAVEMEVRGQINDKIISAMRNAGMTHAELAKTAQTSRSRLTAILNSDRRHVSTDLMLRILAVLGYQTKLSFRRRRSAA